MNHQNMRVEDTTNHQGEEDSRRATQRILNERDVRSRRAKRQRKATYGRSALLGTLLACLLGLATHLHRLLLQLLSSSNSNKIKEKDKRKCGAK